MERRRPARTRAGLRSHALRHWRTNGDSEWPAGQLRLDRAPLAPVWFLSQSEYREGDMPSSARVALITGCGKPIGIGNSTARALAAAGVTVVVSDVVPTGVANE